MKSNKKHDNDNKNLLTSIRMNQLMIEQLAKSNTNISSDLSHLFGIITELQYKVAALCEFNAVDSDQLQGIVDKLRLKDFDAAALQEDIKENLIDIERISLKSTIVITSQAEDDTKSIFRSRIKVSELGNNELMDLFFNKQVNDEVQTTLNNIKHTIKILSVKESKNDPNNEQK